MAPTKKGRAKTARHRRSRHSQDSRILVSSEDIRVSSESKPIVYSDNEAWLKRAAYQAHIDSLPSKSGDHRVLAKHCVPAGKRASKHRNDSSLHLKGRGRTAVYGGYLPDGSRVVVDRLADLDAIVDFCPRERKQHTSSHVPGAYVPVSADTFEGITCYGKSKARTRLRTLDSGEVIEVPARQLTLADMWERM